LSSGTGRGARSPRPPHGQWRPAAAPGAAWTRRARPVAIYRAGIWGVPRDDDHRFPGTRLRNETGRVGAPSGF